MIAALVAALHCLAPAQAVAQSCDLSDCGRVCSIDCGMDCSLQGPASHVLISEVLYNTPNEEEWVEIFNPTDEVVIIDQWTLDDGQIADPSGNEGAWQIVTHHPRANFGIAPGGFVVIAQNADVFFDNHCFYPDFALIVGNTSARPVTPLFTSTFLLHNGRDEVYLRDAGGDIVDAMSWDYQFNDDSPDECRGLNESSHDPLRWPLRRHTGGYMSAIRHDPANPAGPPAIQGHEAGGDPLQEELASVWTHIRSRGLTYSEDGSHCEPDDMGTGIAHAGPDTGGLIVFPYVGGLTVTSTPAGTGSLSLTVQGQAFQPGSAVAFSGDGIHVRETTWLSSEAIFVVIDVRASATPGLRDVTVLTPEGFGDTAPGLFEVTPHQVKPAERVVISELMIDPAGGDQLDQWVELHNPTSDFVILDDWTVSSHDVTLTLPDPVPGQDDLIFMPQGSVVLAVDADRFQATYGMAPDLAVDPGSTSARQVEESGGVFAMAGQDGQIYLHDSGGVLVDAVGWGDGQPAGEDQIQFPLFFTAENGATLLRISRHAEGLAQGGRLNERLVEAFEVSNMVSDPGEGPETGGLQAIPIIDGVMPAEVEQDSQGVALVVTGQNFEPTSTLSITDTGIVFQSVSFISSERMEATIDVELAAPASLRDVVVTNPGGYEGRLPGGFRVIQPVPVITSVTPSSVFQGDSSVTLSVQGERTHFTDGDSQVLLGDGTGYAVESIQVHAADHLEATVSFLLDVVPGTRDVRVSTSAWNEAATGVDMLEVRPLPRIAVVNPGSGNQGASMQVTLTGLYTHFSSDTPSVSFGPDINVTSVTVIDDAHLNAGIEIGPYASLGPRGVTVTTGAEVAGSPEPVFEVLPRPAVSTVTPARAQQGDSVFVALEGINTTWEPGVSTADLGDGIVIHGLTVNGPASAVAELEVDIDATPGPRDVVVTTGAEVADLPGGFTVEGKPRVVSVAPDAVVQGETAVTLDIEGVFTTWSTASQVSFTDAGMTVSAVNVSSPTSLSISVDVDSDAPTGLRDAMVVTGEETALGGGALRVVAPTYVSAVSPGKGVQGGSATVEVLGSNTSFSDGISTVSFGEGITVAAMQVTSRSRLIAEVSIDEGAAVGPRDVAVTTGDEIAVGHALFLVEPFPFIDTVSPAFGAQGSLVEVTVTGVHTGFDAGTFMAFGPGVAVLETSVVSPTEARAELAISLDASPGPRDVTVVTGASIAVGSELFEVLERPRLVSIAPDAAETGVALTVVVSGRATSFQQGLTTVSLGPDIAVTEVRVTSETSLEADMVIGGKAAEGPRDLGVITGEESLVLPESFMVLLRPRIARITPSTAGQGETLVVEVEGRGTGFADETPSFSLGEGVSVENLRVSGQLRFVADIAVDLFAAPGPRDVVVESDERRLVLDDGFNVRPTARVVGVAPEIARRDDSLTVTLTGLNTSWGAGSQALFGDGITVNDTRCIEATTCEADILIQRHARLGSRDVSVITGTETAFGASSFEVLARAEVVSLFPEQIVQGTAASAHVVIAGARISGEPGALNLGDGLTVSDVQIGSDIQSASFIVTADENARVGSRDLTVVTIEAGSLVLPDAAWVVGRPRVVEVQPPGILRGKVSTLDLFGHRTSFDEGASTVDLGAGVTVMESEVLDSDHLRVEVSVDSGASLGPRDVVVTTGSEVAIGASLVSILEPAGDDEAPGAGAPSGCSCASDGEGSSGLLPALLAGLLLAMGSRRRGGRGPGSSTRNHRGGQAPSIGGCSSHE